MSSGSSSRTVSHDGGDEVHVGVAGLGVAASGTRLVTNGVGSCLAVVLYDESAAVGGLAHPMLPERSSERGPDEKYVVSSVEQLLEAVVEAGGARENVRAKFAGGASILSSTGEGVGQRNVRAAISSLDDLDVPLAGTDTGGEQGRIVSLDSGTGVVTVKRAHGKHLQL